MAKGMPTSNPSFELWLWFVGIMVGLCDATSVPELAELGEGEFEKEELDETLDNVVLVDVPDSSEILIVVAGNLVVSDVLTTVAGNVVVPESCDLSIAANGYGSSEVVRFVVQQLGLPFPSCPVTPAQHQLLPLESQRLTSV